MPAEAGETETEIGGGGGGGGALVLEPQPERIVAVKSPNAIARDRFISRMAVPPAVRFFATEGRGTLSRPDFYLLGCFIEP
jgi:hypothetical protein